MLKNIIELVESLRTTRLKINSVYKLLEHTVHGKLRERRGAAPRIKFYSLYYTAPFSSVSLK